MKERKKERKSGSWGESRVPTLVDTHLTEDIGMAWLGLNGVLEYVVYSWSNYCKKKKKKKKSSQFEESDTHGRKKKSVLGEHHKFHWRTHGGQFWRKGWSFSGGVFIFYLIWGSSKCSFSRQARRYLIIFCPIEKDVAMMEWFFFFTFWFSWGYLNLLSCPFLFGEKTLYTIRPIFFFLH